jgi:hypothetical protein
MDSGSQDYFLSGRGVTPGFPFWIPDPQSRRERVTMFRSHPILSESYEVPIGRGDAGACGRNPKFAALQFLEAG